MVLLETGTEDGARAASVVRPRKRGIGGLQTSKEIAVLTGMATSDVAAAALKTRGREELLMVTIAGPKEEMG